MSNILQSLAWRYATKRYDATKKLSAEQLTLIKESLRLAPSSFGLQPYKIIHVTNPELRTQLQAAAWGQAQFVEASDIFILAARRTIDEAYINSYFSLVSAERNLSAESLNAYRDMVVGSVMGKSADARLEWMRHQTYIPLGVALSVAADNGIDATPMEGFDASAFDTILGLEALGLTSCLTLAVGFRSAEDAHQHDAKVRLASDVLFIEK
jgi:nitroreductase